MGGQPLGRSTPTRSGPSGMVCARTRPSSAPTCRATSAIPTATKSPTRSITTRALLCVAARSSWSSAWSRLLRTSIASRYSARAEVLRLREIIKQHLGASGPLRDPIPKRAPGVPGGPSRVPGSPSGGVPRGPRASPGGPRALPGCPGVLRIQRIQAHAKSAKSV